MEKVKSSKRKLAKLSKSSEIREMSPNESSSCLKSMNPSKKQKTDIKSKQKRSTLANEEHSSDTKLFNKLKFFNQLTDCPSDLRIQKAIYGSKLFTKAFLEPKPSIKAIFESKSSTKTILEPKSSTKAILESKPSTKAILESKPSTKAILESKPSTKAILESKPSTKAILESKPSTKAIFEPKSSTKEYQKIEVLLNNLKESIVLEPINSKQKEHLENAMHSFESVKELLNKVEEQILAAQSSLNKAKELNGGLNLNGKVQLFKDSKLWLTRRRFGMLDQTETINAYISSLFTAVTTVSQTFRKNLNGGASKNYISDVKKEAFSLEIKCQLYEAVQHKFPGLVKYKPNYVFEVNRAIEKKLITLNNHYKYLTKVQLKEENVDIVNLTRYDAIDFEEYDEFVKDPVSFAKKYERSKIKT